MSALTLPRLYPILDLEALGERGLSPQAVLDVWLESGIRFWQLRAKCLATGPLLALVDDLLERTRRVGGRLIVNDRADVAVMARADGVHVGQTDLPVGAVRQLVGPALIVGQSTHTATHLDAARREGVSYLAIGPVFRTTSKSGANDPLVGLEGVRAAARKANPRQLPVVAIGGITLERAPQVLAAGAQSVAVIADLLVGDLGTRVRRFTQTLEALTL